MPVRVLLAGPGGPERHLGQWWRGADGPLVHTARIARVGTFSLLVTFNSHLPKAGPERGADRGAQVVGLGASRSVSVFTWPPLLTRPAPGGGTPRGRSGISSQPGPLYAIIYIADYHVALYVDHCLTRVHPHRRRLNATGLQALPRPYPGLPGIFLPHQYRGKHMEFDVLI